MIDQDLKVKGHGLFVTCCRKCHQDIDRKAADRKVVAKLSDEKTDPTMAEKFLSRKSQTGVLNGRHLEPLSINPKEFGFEAPVGLMLKHLAQGSILRSTDQLQIASPLEIARALNEFQSSVDYRVSGTTVSGPLQIRHSGHFESGGIHGVLWRISDERGHLLSAAIDRVEHLIDGQHKMELHYKARPLNGIWASAPYLHNGSIPNLDELLKCPNKRSQAVIKVGSREFDPVKVGFRTDTGEDFNPTLTGNHNTGHNYGHAGGRPFSEAERRQLIEYMKSFVSDAGIAIMELIFVLTICRKYSGFMIKEFGFAE